MDPQAVKYLSAAIAVLPLAAVGLALGRYFSAIIEAISRNPSVEPVIKKTHLMYFALIEAVALFALGVALMILFL
jgi:F0F1-type ATP synthase membrane subunit c/vacuolar-type H+-ATPase subunit K